MRADSVRLFSLVIFTLCLTFSQSTAFAEESVVHAILFYSPTCSHCQQVINEDLPPLIERYGNQLIIIGIDASVPEGAQLYQSAVASLQIPDNRRGVPTLIVGEVILVGSEEIPEQFPMIIENGISSGGIGWPEFPGFNELIEEIDEGQTNSWIPEASLNELTLIERFSQDLTGNIIAVIVLAGMVFSVIVIGIAIAKPLSIKTGRWPNWVIPLLATIGILVAAYLSYIEITRSEAVCGPIGDCNTVQQSPYVYLFDIIPIGILGITGYLMIGFTWIVQQITSNENWKYSTALVLWLLAAIGTTFSIYLTVLEPFFIGATCAWCITSAIVTTLIFIAATEPAITAWNKIKE